MGSVMGYCMGWLWVTVCDSYGYRYVIVWLSYGYRYVTQWLQDGITLWARVWDREIRPQFSRAE